MANMSFILGDLDWLKAVVEDFVNYYMKRVLEGVILKGKVMFVCSSRFIVYEFYKEIIVLWLDWIEVKVSEEGVELSEKEKKEIKFMEWIKMIMIRGKDDEEELYNLFGIKDYWKELDW